MTIAEPLEYILARIAISDTGCWLYPLTPGVEYGHIRVDGRTRGTHRVVYEAIVGPIPDGLSLDHLCRVKACCCPDHLEPVTVGENNRRAMPFRKVYPKTVRVHTGRRVVDVLLTPDQVAAELGISYRKVQALIADGTLPHYRLGRDPRSGYRIGRSDLDHYKSTLRPQAGET